MDEGPRDMEDEYVPLESYYSFCYCVYFKDQEGRRRQGGEVRFCECVSDVPFSIGGV